MKKSFYSRFGRPIIVIVAILFPLTVWGAVLALATNKNDVKEWLPESFKETQDYHEFERHFGNDTFVLASWDGCTLDDTRLDQLAQLLSASSDRAEARYFTKVMTGRSLLRQLSEAPTSLPTDEILKRLAGSFVGPDGRQTCAVLTLSADGKAQLRETLEAIYSTAAEKCGVPRSSIRTNAFC